jgi:hypothetical protein
MCETDQVFQFHVDKPKGKRLIGRLQTHMAEEF